MISFLEWKFLILVILTTVAVEPVWSQLDGESDYHVIWKTVHRFNYSHTCETDYWPNFFCSYSEDNSCFSIQEMCDGHRDCNNVADECYSMCTETFRCQSNSNECIASDEFCDGVVDCQDGSDELDDDDDGSGFSCVNVWRFMPADNITSDDWTEKRVSKNWRVREQWKNQTTKNKWKTEKRRKCRLPNNLVCDGINHCGDHSDECSREANCGDENKFYCSNKKCISKNNVCDGRDDCGDGSDECNDRCANIYQCKSGNPSCIPLTKFCDGKMDCSDGSDEITLADERLIDEKHFSKDSVMCSNVKNKSPLQCRLPSQYNCDGHEHCLNREDECIPGCQYSMLCPNSKKCFPNVRLCDGIDDCGDMSDECHSNCTWLYQCNNGSCLSLDRFCDGKKDCLEGEDEITEDLNSNENDVYCNSHKLNKTSRHQPKRLCLLPSQYVCDDFDHCDDRSDQCQRGCTASFFCDDGKTCIQREKINDEVLDCKDGSDEPGYGLQIFSQRGFKCRLHRFGITKEYVLPQQLLQDNIADCIDQTDLCYMENGTSHHRSGRCFSCFLDSNILIYEKQICNGVIDCPDLSDECLCEDTKFSQICQKLCFNPNDAEENSFCKIEQTYSCSKNTSCIPASFVCNGRKECFDGSDEESCGGNMQRTERKRCSSYKLDSGWTPEYATYCNKKAECMAMEDECYSECDPLPEYCSLRAPNGYYTCPDHQMLAGKAVCNGRQDCYTGPYDEQNCTGRFYCTHGYNISLLSSSIDLHKEDIISVEKEAVCDFEIDCVFASDEINCPSTHFYCENKQHPIFIRRQKVMDGKRDCSDGSDECPRELFDGKIISSREFLIKLPFLQFMVWIMGPIAIVGNLCVIVCTVNQLCLARRKKLSRVAFMNKLLIVSLASADLLMGVLLIALAIKNTLTYGQYCHYDRDWRSGLLCQTLGVIATISAEVSLITLALLASYRLYCVLRPLDSRTVKPQKTLVLIILSWLVGIIIAYIPLIKLYEYYFVTHLWIRNSLFFKTDVVSQKTLIPFCKTFFLYNMTRNRDINKSENCANIACCLEWKGIIESIELSHKSQTKPTTFGYYSIHATCLPKLFLLPNEPSREYSLGIAILNFLICSYIVGCYVSLWKLRQDVSKPGSGSRKKSLQKRITLLVTSNCACWLPISIIAFLNHSGIAISSSFYAFTAIVLFPINSALNPILYSNVLQIAWRKVESCLKKCEFYNKLTRNARQMFLDKCIARSQNEAAGTQMSLLPPSPLLAGHSRIITELTIIEHSHMPESSV